MSIVHAMFVISISLEFIIVQSLIYTCDLCDLKINYLSKSISVKGLMSNRVSLNLYILYIFYMLY